MTDRYVVIGNPVAHSKSPLIHARFAQATGQDLQYQRLEAPLDGFAATARAFFAAGGCGANVTVPFKEEAWQLADITHLPADIAGTANTLWRNAAGQIEATNTDGIGLVRDLVVNHRVALAGRRVLVLGAGGAAAGVLCPLLWQADFLPQPAIPASVTLVNRTRARAERLREHLLQHPTVQARAAEQADWQPAQRLAVMDFAALAEQAPFDVVINATSSGLSGEALPLPAGVFAAGAVAYDMMYGRETPFMAVARAAGAQVIDGLGMLVEQAAEAFYVWRGVRPATAPVLAALREGLA